MKAYEDVVADRFDKQDSNEPSIYDADQPIGRYIRKTMFRELHTFLDHKFADKKKRSELFLLDAGCGTGGMLEFFAASGFSKKNLTGFDLSEQRVLQARKKLEEAHLVKADITQFSFPEMKFDLITSFDLFSHLTSKEQIILGLNQIQNHLKTNGIFLWFDIYSKDHFTPPAGVDSWGFNRRQMIDLAADAGFVPIYQKALFKTFFNKYSSVYQVKRLPAGLVKFLEYVLPGHPGNMMIVFRKAST